MKTQINEIKRMQQLAGVINESQLNEEEVKSVDQVLDTPKTQEISKKLSQDPALLQKSIDQLAKLGIDKNTLMKAAQAHSSGKDVGTIIDDKVETAIEKVNEASGFTDAGKMISGLAVGLTGLSLVGGLPVLAGAVILALIGAGVAAVGSKIDYKQQQAQNESLDIEEVVNEALKAVRKEEVNELFGLFGGNKEKKSAPKVLKVYWKLEQGALEPTGVYFPSTQKGKKDFDEWSNDLRQVRDNASRSNNPNQSFPCRVGNLNPKVTDVYITWKEIPYEKGMKVYTEFTGDLCGPEEKGTIYSHENIINGKMK